MRLVSGTARMMTRFAVRTEKLRTTVAIIVVWALIVPIAPTVSAQQLGCDVVTDLRLGNTTDLAEGNFKCIEQHIADLRNLREMLSNLQDQLESTRSELAALQHGAVIAFDRSEEIVPSGVASLGACPPRWSLFRAAGGRVIVGAGQHENTDEQGQLLMTYPSYSDNESRAIGGEEKHILTIDEMPAHQHALKLLKTARGNGNGVVQWRSGGNPH